ncbi:hypothetical protein GF382_00170 [Candidatus Falkowbacteria bacterium]|nr:hypothetical protein [Candidatus Falkowbacteria bacterium]
MDENKNQNEELFDDENQNDSDSYQGSYPSWMGNEDQDEEDEESLGHESLDEDQELDIDEYEEGEKNPVLGNYQEEDEDEDEDSEEEDEEDESIYDEDDDEEKEESRDNIYMAKSKVVLIKKLLANIKENSDRLNRLLGGLVSEEDEARIKISEMTDGLVGADDDEEAGKIIEGVFDGENMVGPDGKQYSVPSNYASKSKLVEGDLLKLTITHSGTFVYKQIKPIERARIIGTLEKAADGSYIAVSEDRKWRVLNASITYFKGEAGDEVVVLVPKMAESKWAAVENIVKNK